MLKLFVQNTGTFTMQVDAICFLHTNRRQIICYSKSQWFLGDEDETVYYTYNGMNRISSSQSQDICTRDYPGAWSFKKALYCVNEAKASQSNIWNRVLFSLIGLCWVQKHWSVTTLKL